MRQVPDDLDLLFLAEPKARKIFSQKLEDETERQYQLLLAQKDRDAEHDNLVATCASAFAPGNFLHEKTGWSFFSTDPLFELAFNDQGEYILAPKHFDLLLIKEAARRILAVECKSAKPTTNLFAYKKDIRSVWERAEVLEDNKPYLSDRLGFEIDHIEYVLCVPYEELNKAARSLHSVEEEARRLAGKAYSQPVIRLWLCQLTSNRRLLLVLQIQRANPDWNSHNDRNLNRYLRDGYELEGNEFASLCFPTSPSWQQARAAILSLLGEHEEASLDLERPKEFTREDVVEFFKDSILHYGGERIAVHLADVFTKNAGEFALIRKLANGAYKPIIQGRSLSTIAKRFVDGYMRGLATRTAHTAATEYIRSLYHQRVFPLFPEIARAPQDTRENHSETGQ